MGLIADAHRAIALETGQFLDDPFGDVRFQPDAIDRLDMAATGLGDDIHQPLDIILHGLERGEAVQRPDHKECIPDPAETVIPVAFRSRRFRDTGGHGGDNRAGGFIGAELERDRRPDHGILPFEGQGEGVDPVAPVIGSAALIFIGRGLNARG